MTGQLPAMVCAAHGWLTHWNTDTEYPIWQATLPGPRLPADQSEHVGTGDDDSIPLAVASAPAMGAWSCSSPHPACARSYFFH